MKSRPFIADIDKMLAENRLDPARPVRMQLLVAQKNLLRQKNGKPYLALMLMDRTGSVEGRVWNDADRYDGECEQGSVVEVEAVVIRYNNRLQLKINRIVKLPESSVEIENFVPASSRDRNQMLDEVRQMLDGMQDDTLREFLLGLLEDESFAAQLIRAPAAKSIHHAYIGGLIEHTLSVMKLCRTVAKLYPELNADLLLAGAFLHDIGKLHEISARAGFEYTDEGRLLGHLVMGAQMLHELAGSGQKLPAETLVQLEHMILSHHGSYEFGSPKRPKTREAMVLHYLDELDAKLQAFQQVSEREAQNRWSSYQRLFDRYLLLRDPKLDDSDFFESPERENSTAAEGAGGGLQPLKSRIMAEQIGKLRRAEKKDDGAQLSLDDVAGGRKRGQ